MRFLRNLITAFTGTPSAAEAPWTGRWVLPRQGGMTIGTTDAQTGVLHPFAPLKWTCYCVLGDQDGWLWIQQDGRDGFIAKEAAVTVEDAEAFFSAVLRTD